MSSRINALQRAGRKLGHDVSKTTGGAEKKSPLALETLPYDILVHICGYLSLDDGPWPCQDPTCGVCADQHRSLPLKKQLAKPLYLNYYAAFSQTCKYLREISIPFLFRAMRIAPRTGEEYRRLRRELQMMQGKGIFERVRKLSIVFSPDVYLDEDLCVKNEFPVFKESDLLLESMETLLRNITKLDILACKIDFVQECFRLDSLPLTKEVRIPVQRLVISYGCGWLLPHLEPKALLIKGTGDTLWYHIIRAPIEATYQSAIKARTASLRLCGADHPKSDTRAFRLHQNLRTCASFLTELRVYTFVVDNTGLKGLYMST
ncbi:hypothetical protein TWF718_007723 [Orbilia javanica]|uniref:Uncharacterized protein n=1 Tax=Orbilia javanica TaxID=47235 RepID=A0AAN8MM37_9PEZI